MGIAVETGESVVAAEASAMVAGFVTDGPVAVAAVGVVVCVGGGAVSALAVMLPAAVLESVVVATIRGPLLGEMFSLAAFETAAAAVVVSAPTGFSVFIGVVVCPLLAVELVTCTGGIVTVLLLLLLLLTGVLDSVMLQAVSAWVVLT